MSESNATISDLSTVLEPRVGLIPTRRAVARAIRAAREARANYRGGLPAERQSYAALKTRLRSRIRAAFLGRRGRRIDLISMLKQRTHKQRPVWALVDPTKPIGNTNGFYDNRGYVQVALARPRKDRDDYWQYSLSLTVHRVKTGIDFLPVGLPALPPRVRQIVASPGVRKRANWVGVLYQPESWRELVDPAVVVEWTDRPGEYYALAVWGADRAVIMEWVD